MSHFNIGSYYRFIDTPVGSGQGDLFNLNYLNLGWVNSEDLLFCIKKTTEGRVLFWNLTNQRYFVLVNGNERWWWSVFVKLTTATSSSTHESELHAEQSELSPSHQD